MLNAIVDFSLKNRAVVLILAALATPAMAETARVLSGEHGDFTRLVIELYLNWKRPKAIVV